MHVTADEIEADIEDSASIYSRGLPSSDEVPLSLPELSLQHPLIPIESTSDYQLSFSERYHHHLLAIF